MSSGDGSLRLVVAGKGGVGKSTIAALAARLLARAGRPVVAIDADEQMNLAATLGLEGAEVRPLADQEAYIAEKSGALPGVGGMLRLDPDVDDVVSRMGVTGPDGVRLLVMGGVRGAGRGCLCPEHTVLSSVIAAMGRRRGEVVVMDTHAGVEHFGRSLARGFDTALVVTDPTFNAVEVAVRTARLAADLGIGSVHLAVNRLRSPADLDRAETLLRRAGGFPFTAVHGLPWDAAALLSEPSVGPLLSGSPLAGAVAGMLDAAGVAAPGPVGVR